jgi:hypothetical protein
MAFPTVTTASPANIKPAAFLAVYAADSTTGLWQTLGSIADGILNVADFTAPDSLGRNKTNGASNFTASCKMKQTAAEELNLIDRICAGTNAFLFKLSDAGAIPGSPAVTAGWVTVTAAQVGCKAKLVGDGTPENDRYILLEWQGSLINSAKDACLKASIDDDLFASSANSVACTSTGFYTIGVYTAAKDGGSPNNTHLKPCGISTIGIADADSAGTQGLSPITNVKMSFEMLATQDGIRRFLPNALDINVEYDWMATDSADLLHLPDFAAANVNVYITTIDGIAFSLLNQTGIETNFEVSGDMDKARVVRFTHKGKILQSSFAATFA